MIRYILQCKAKPYWESIGEHRAKSLSLKIGTFIVALNGVKQP